MNYYNEFDPKAAAWLRQLIVNKLIPDGFVDTRSIADVEPSDLVGYAQCHFFAGIGGWSRALQLSGWSPDRHVWTGSCPCQPFSIGSTDAQGQEDQRHLWPVFARLISECGPSVVFGEQVDAAIRWGWLDEVFSDLENGGYSCAATVLPSRGFGTEHWRDRLFWVAYASSERREGREFSECLSSVPPQTLTEHGDPLAHARSVLAGDWSGLPVVDGLSVGMVRDIVKGAGNSIVPQTAAEFIQASEEALHRLHLGL